MRFDNLVSPLSKITFALCIVLVALGIDFLPTVQAQDRKQANLAQFEMLTPASGWVLLDQNLFWTSDAGQTWDVIGPSIPSDGLIQDVELLDSNVGWVLWTTAKPDGSSSFQLAQTIDHGETWTVRSLSLFESGEIASYAEKAEMGWLNAQQGWISVKQSSGSNFSLGTLFTTADGGNHWTRFALPVADKIYFNNPQIGVAVGGPTGNEVFATEDGGAVWKNVTPADTSDGNRALTYPSHISDGQNLFVLVDHGAHNGLKIYSFENSPDHWSLTSQISLDIQPGIIPISVLEAQNFVATIPGTKSIVRMMNGHADLLENMDGLSTSIVDLDMVSLEVGWAKSIDSQCNTDPLPAPGSASVTCSAVTRLLQTKNGGITWQTISLPITHADGVASDALSSGATITTNTISATGNTEILIGQGFDRCEIPTLSQMQTWWNSGPYKAVNLYIGGSSRACGNAVLSSSYLFQLHQQGWKFFPTWVGPQAPCTGFSSRISSDVTVAYNQGVSEANLAVDRLGELGLTDPSKTGSVVYYDIEQYGTNTACRSAVNSFMNGWVSQIRLRGNLAGIYGSTLCNTGLSDFLTIPNVPDVIWPARWYHNLGSGYYDPNANVWNLGSCVPNSVWSNHQRIRQYEGDHNETWGNMTLNIDSNALDGIVAFPYDYPFVSTIVRADSTPTGAASVRFTVVFSKPVTGVNRADFVLSTTGVAGASISSVSGSGTTYTVAVNTGTADGTIRLDVVDDDSITDAVGNSLGGAGIRNGDFNSGDVYAIIRYMNISGNVGVAGATLSYVDNTPKTVTADGRGNYSIQLPTGWSGTVTPSHPCYTFSPVNRSYSNLIANQSAQSYVPGFNGNAACAMGAGTYDDSHAAWVYSGSWATLNIAGAYNNNLHYTFATGDFALFPFTGTRFILTYTRDTNRANYDIYVDGNKITRINASGTFQWQRTYTSPVFSPGTHVVEFRNVGGGGGVMDVDAIQILATAAPGAGTYDDGHPIWSYSGSWAILNTSGPYNNTLHYTFTTGDSAWFSFNGTQFILSYTRDTNRADYDVYVDGSKIVTIHANGTFQWQKTYTSPVFASGMHVVEFRNVGGGGGVMDVDAIQILATTAPGTGTYDDADSNWAYAGSWLLYSSSGPYSNTLHYTFITGDSARFAFNGTQFVLIYTQDTNRANYDVYVDGKQVARIHANGAFQWQRTYTSPIFPSGMHVVEFRNVGGGGGVMDVDAIQVLATAAPGTGTYDDGDSNWAYAGSWLLYSSSGPYNNTLHYTFITGDSASFTFNGTQFVLTYTRDINRANYDVYVDGSYTTTINANGAFQWQRTYTSPVFSAGTHVVEFRNAGGGGGVMDVDAITIN